MYYENLSTQTFLFNPSLIFPRIHGTILLTWARTSITPRRVFESLFLSLYSYQIQSFSREVTVTFPTWSHDFLISVLLVKPLETVSGPFYFHLPWFRHRHYSFVSKIRKRLLNYLSWPTGSLILLTSFSVRDLLLV